MVYSLLVLLSFLPLVLSNGNSSMAWQRRENTRNQQTWDATTKKVMSAVIDRSNVELKKTFKELKNYALLQNDLKGSLSKDFTICSSIFSTKDFIHFFPILLGKDEDVFVRTYIRNTDTGLVTASTVGLNIKFGQSVESHKDGNRLPKVFPDQWVKSCLALSLESGSIKLVVDGILIHNITSATLKKAANDSPTNMTGKLIMGAVKFSAGWKSINFKATSINIFSSALSVKTMKEKTEHNAKNCYEESDYLNWEDMEWETKGEIHVETVATEELCSKKSKMIMFPSQFVKMSDCMHHCQKLGGRAPEVVNKDQWQELQGFMNLNFFGKKDSNLQALGGLWMSVSDTKEEGIWRDFYTGEPITYTGPFTGRGPNGGKVENCAIQVSKDNWVDSFCDIKQFNNFCVCSHEKRPFLRLRGLCPDSAVDWLYIPKNNKVGQIQYVSSQGSFISYDKEKRVWSFNKTGFDTTGLSTSSKVSFLLGKHNWTIENDSYVCGLGKPYTKQLKLTSCSEEQFTCSSGQCVRMEDRCDQLANCMDQSDEENCQLLVLRKGYNKKIPPIVPDADNPETKALIPLEVSLTLLKVVSIEEVRHSIELQFQIEVGWYESRAAYNNLNENSAMNVLMSQDIETLWLPLITYTNTDQKETTRLAEMSEWSTRVTVRKEGNLTRGGMELVDEVEIFQGDQNHLVMAQVYTKTFQCQMDFQLYPFDTQTCTIRMDTSDDGLKVVRLVPQQLTMNETLDLTLFKITSWSLEYVDANREEEGVSMKMDLKRKVMNELLTTFLPSILLMIITFATTFFKPFFFEAALSVNLTTMLMMTTISIGKMQMLPTAAYIRMIDVWLVFCQLVPFAEVILLTAQEYHRIEDPKENQAGMVFVESEKNTVGPGTLVEDNGAAAVGETKCDTSPKRMLQWLRALGALKN